MVYVTTASNLYVIYINMGLIICILELNEKRFGDLEMLDLHLEDILYGAMLLNKIFREIKIVTN